jgi:hypothetical protein
MWFLPYRRVSKSVYLFALHSFALKYTIHKAYENEESVGKGIRESGLKREELYVTTKYQKGDIQSAVRNSLAKVSFPFSHTMIPLLMRSGA